MATQEILVNYNADVSKLTEQLNKVASAQDKVSDTAKETSDEVKKSTVTQEQAAKKRIELLKKEEAELKKLQADRKKAFDPKVIADFDKKIAESTTKIQTLGGKTKQSLAGVGSQITTIGASIATAFGAALSVGAIINFSKATVTAFLDAQKNAEKLKFAITQIGGESEAVFDKLIAQSKELQETTIFSDDSVQSAQAALSAFGLTGDEIERLLPKLTDFATVTQKTLEEAAQAVGQGLQGMGRDFKRYNIDVDGAASKTDNLNKILSGFDQFAGAAANATKTLAGQLQQATNQADELEESIGEKLAPAFVRARLAALEFAKEAVDFILNTDEAMRKLLKTLGLLPAEVAKTGDNFKSFTQVILEQVDAAKTLTEFDEIALKIRNDQTKAIAEQQAVVDRLQQSKETALAREVVNLEEVRSIQQAITKQQDTNLQNEISKLNIIEDLLTKQRAVLTGRKEEEKEASDARVAGSAAEVKALKLLGAEYSALFELLSDEQRQRLIELSVTAEIDSEEEIKDKINRLEEIFKANDLTIPVSTDPEGSIPDLERRLLQLRTSLEQNEIKVPLDIEITSLNNFRAQVAAIAAENAKEVTIPVTLEPRLDTVKFDDGIKKIKDQSEELKQQQEQILQESQSLLGSLTDLYQNYTDARLQQINDELNAQLDSLDIQQETIDKNLAKRRISETEAQVLSERLLKQKLEAERQAAEKERALKRRQAILDKANALIQITINTAQGISKALATSGPAAVALAALIAAAGAAQAAVVVSQPIAYKKGSKDTGAKDHMALVGEDGAEMVYMPAHSKVLPAPQTKTYGEALEAMRKKQFDQYISEKYITPALVAQKKQDDKVKRKSFAENLAQSITYNTVSQTPAKKLQDVSVTNVDALARGIARELKQDIYR